MSRYRGLQVLSYFIELSSFHIYLQSPSGQHDVKKKKALNWHELVQIPALLFNSWAVMWPHSLSVSASVKWGQHLLCILLWGLEIMSIRVQHRASCTDLTLQELREAMCTCTNNGADKMVLHERWEPWEPSRKRDECRMVSWESVFWVRLENGQDIDRPWEKEQFQMEEKLWRKQGLLLFDSGTQPSSARASHLALINHFSSLLHGASTVSLHHRWRALDVLLDGWHQTSIVFS